MPARSRPLPVAVALALLALLLGGLGHGAGLVSGRAVAAGAEQAPTASEDEQAPFIDFTAVSAAEIEILESLVARREELEARARELDMREKLLATTELKIDAKIVELKKIEASIAGSIKQIDEREEAKIKSLVKIYERMKAKDAARIFNQLDENILLSVVERMREAKAAEVIARMSGDKARVVTMNLARRRSLPSVDAKQTPGM